MTKRKLLTYIFIVLSFMLFFILFLFIRDDKMFSSNELKELSDFKVKGEKLIKRTNDSSNIKQSVIPSKYTSDKFQAGMNLLVYGHPDISVARSLFHYLQELGINCVAITFPFTQKNVEANQVMADPIITPTIPELQRLIESAHHTGLCVMLRPILDEVNLMESGLWRGQIRPSDPNAWFDSYRSLLLTYAELAQSTKTKVFNIGTELNSLESNYNNQWISLIQDVREVYKGELIYSFNWDRVNDIHSIQFTQLIDHIGIDAYFPLQSPNGATVEMLEKEWETWINENKDALHHHSIIITEAGTLPIAGSHRTPYAWSIPGGEFDWQTQANYYEATFRAWKPMIHGIYWWAVTLEQDSTEITYSPLFSPTELIIRRYFSSKADNLSQ